MMILFKILYERIHFLLHCLLKVFDIDSPFYEYLSTNITMNIFNIVNRLWIHTTISNYKDIEIKFGYNMSMFMSPYEIAQNVF